MPVRVECPACGKGIQAPSKYRGKKIKCPGCDEPFVIPAAPSSNTAPEPKQQSLSPVPPPLVPPPLPPKDFGSSSSDGPPNADVPVDTIACPFCAESIKAAAKKCKHCGEFLDGQSPTPQEKTNEFQEASRRGRSFELKNPVKYRFENPSNGHTEDVYSGVWFWVLLFGPIYFAVKGVWTHFVAGILIAVFVIPTFGMSWLIYPFFASRIMRKHYLSKGWVEISE